MNVQDVDDLLGLPARLAIVATLAGAGPRTFSALGEETGLADGNLHVQTRRLVEAGYLERSRTRQGRRTVTLFELTHRGRAALRAHVNRLQDALSGAEPRRPAAPRRGELGSRDDASRVW